MSKTFLKLGIDHGTSNSSICVMEPGGPRVIRADGMDEIMPSVVYMDKFGKTLIGRSASNAMLNTKAGDGDGHAGFKPDIGQSLKYEFRAAKKTLSAAELGGLVMGHLLRAYRDEANEDTIGAVITVPAKFEHSACEGTRAAARLAGLKFFPQIQTIAASMAYGFTASDRRAQWMVFDLGGGTLDVSLMYVRDGRMDVPEEGHAGDNRLGGRKFDREIMDFVLRVLRKQYALEHFSEANPTYNQAWGRLIQACANAKVKLSNKDQTVVELDGVLCQDEKGKDVVVEIPIERAQYVEMIAPDVQKAVHLCRTLLQSNRLTAKDLDRVILVGGPTKTPYIQTALSEGLGIEVKPTIDPMTAVTIGAAIHAAAIELPEEFRPTVQVAETIEVFFVSIKLEYERTPQTALCSVAGKVEGVVDFSGLKVEIRRGDGWSSGDISVSEDGSFECEVLLLDEGVCKPSNFETRVFGKNRELLTSLAEPQILYPYRGVEGRLANTLLIGTEGNRTVTLLKKGGALPGKGSERFMTTKALKRGSGEDMLHIPVLEGVSNLFGEENTSADLNVHIGSLVIKGDDARLTQDLPAGSHLHVTVHQDESREVKCIAFVELLDDEFSGTIKGEAFGIDVKGVSSRFTSAKEALEEARKLQSEFPTPGLDEKFKIIQDLNVVDEISKEMARAEQGENVSLSRAYRRTLELAGALQILTEAQAEARIRSHITRLKKAVSDQEVKDLQDIERDFERAVLEQEHRQFSKCEEALKGLDWRVRTRPYFDVVIDLASECGIRITKLQSDVWDDADALIKRLDAKGGRESLTAADLAELQAMHKKLVDIFPDLFERRQKYLNEIKTDDAPKLGLRSDVRKADTARHD